MSVQSKAVNPVNSFMRTSRIVVVPTKKDGFSFTPQELILDCSCAVTRKGRSKIRDLLGVLDELQATQNWRMDFEFSWASRLVLTLKLSIKRPIMLMNMVCKAAVFEIQSPQGCVRHQLALKKSRIWYSVTASRVGFPWSDDSFINSLNAIRDLKYDFLIFSSDVSSRHKSQPLLAETKIIVQNKIANQSYQVLMHSKEVEALVINEKWGATQLCSISEATIHNGSVLSQSGRYLPLDHSWSPRDRPLRMAPCSIWAADRDDSRLDTLIIPGTFYEPQNFSEGFFVDGSTNFYHFLSESLRPLIMSLQAGVIPERVFIKDGLPFQFYEILRSLCPNSEVIVLEKGSATQVKNLSFGVITGKLSKSNEVFSRYNADDLKLGDEFKTWSFLREHFGGGYSKSQEFYVPRQKQETRGLLNGLSIENFLSKNGMEIIRAHEEKFSSQVKIFSQAKTFCSTSGAGLLNMIFMPEGSKVIEIVFPFGHSWQFLSDLFHINHTKVQVSSILPKNLELAIDSYYLPLWKIRKEIFSKS